MSDGLVFFGLFTLPENGGYVETVFIFLQHKDFYTMAYTWSKDLETGNSLIDQQHQELIRAINNLLTACMQGKAKETLHPTLDFLLSYTKRHFGDEENLQQKSGYPDYPNHKQMHAGFVKFVDGLVQEVKAEGITATTVSKITSGVGDWLVNHIKKEDTKVAAHLRKSA
ncbi:hemerythrin [Planctomycetales bacterium]|nr:hemerythrin [Planctomycetales bacterium]